MHRNGVADELGKQEMKFELSLNPEWIIPESNFTQSYIDSRLSEVIDVDRPFLRSCLNYLYGSTKTLDKERLVTSEQYLTSAERVLIRWLHTRSNGSERANYGPDCVVVAKASRFRCSQCLNPDVRVLQIDHVNGRGADVEKSFDCLCANCHMIKSREKNWSGKRSA
jgi:hypothetical protein